ncbi:hypothetical protein K492DRAFT_208389 [Lichtheimia hyalospora FSU 10163]|nr:hypothetical protein K492DRAFT_208389 [Lichtheimia hyalospora FSU 10163]
MLSTPSTLSCPTTDNTPSCDVKRRYQCDICHKWFSRPTALRTHTYIHTGEKPFECSITGCGRRFAVVSNLRRHYRVHFKSDNHPNTPKIPAVQRIRQVQQLMERAASSSTPMSVSTNGRRSIHETTTTSNESGTSTDAATTRWDDPIQVYGIPKVTHSENQHTTTIMAVPQYNNNMSIASLLNTPHRSSNHSPIVLASSDN